MWCETTLSWESEVTLMTMMTMLELVRSVSMSDRSHNTALDQYQQLHCYSASLHHSSTLLMWDWNNGNGLNWKNNEALAFKVIFRYQVWIIACHDRHTCAASVLHSLVTGHQLVMVKCHVVLSHDQAGINYSLQCLLVVFNYCGWPPVHWSQQSRGD